MRLDGLSSGHIWKPPQLTIPPRSRLYRLEPVGVGTAWVESLSGYISRLAEAHTVSTGVLFGHEISQLVDKAYLKKERIKDLAQALWRLGGDYAATLNGVGTDVTEWVGALEALTMRSGLRALTMSTWREVLSTKSLLRRKRAWCPACYEDRRASGQLVYDPLMWFLKPVTMCLIHRRRLRTVCGFCRKEFFVLANGSRPGYCSICRQWLGETPRIEIAEHESLSDAAFDWEELTATNIGEIIAAAPKLNSIPPNANITLSLYACRKRNSGVSGPLSCGPLHRSVLRYWLRGNRALLDMLLRYCFYCKVSLLEFLTANIPIETAGDPSSDISDHKAKTSVRCLGVNMELAKIESMLKKALEEKPPPALLNVIQRMEIAYELVYKYFPDLGRAIHERFLAYEKDSFTERSLAARRALEDALKDETRPKPSDVARIIGWSAQSLFKIFPELWRALSKRHTEGQEEKRMAVEQELKRLLVEWPPLPSLEVAKRTGYSRTTIIRRFPDLYRRLIARHKDYSKARRTCEKVT